MNQATTISTGTTLTNLFDGKHSGPPPVWLMRQAGRYLPEYRELRTKAGSFLDLCYAPKMACEVTMQPMRRFDFDAAILFADILIVPHALGQQVSFEAGEGPRLAPITDAAGLSVLDLNATAPRFDSICETVSLIRAALDPKKSLIGFCGAPWTVATYVVAGRGTTDQAPARKFAYRDPKAFGQLIDILTEASITYLSAQIKAGADVVQIFDSWAGSLPDDEFQRWVMAPTKRIVAALKAAHPEVPVIGFPRGANASGPLYIRETGVDGIGCDTAMPLTEMFGEQADLAVVQGNLDPLLLVTGGAAMDKRIDEILAASRGRRFIFNLGHGIVPETPPEHVTQLMTRVRAAV